MSGNPVYRIVPLHDLHGLFSISNVDAESIAFLNLENDVGVHSPNHLNHRLLLQDNLDCQRSASSGNQLLTNASPSSSC